MNQKLTRAEMRIKKFSNYNKRLQYFSLKDK